MSLGWTLHSNELCFSYSLYTNVLLLFHYKEKTIQQAYDMKLQLGVIGNCMTHIINFNKVASCSCFRWFFKLLFVSNYLLVVGLNFSLFSKLLLNVVFILFYISWNLKYTITIYRFSSYSNSCMEDFYLLEWNFVWQPNY